jgi:hypothetical protein
MIGTARKGQGKESNDRTARIGQLENNNHDGQENQDIHW